MDIIDIVFAVLLGFSAFRGLRNGLFVELASLVSFFIGIYIAVKFSYLVGGIIGESKTAKVAAFVITLIIVVVAIHLLAKVFSKIADFVFLGWLNKLGGAVFAVLKTILLLGIVLSLFQKVNIDNALISKETQDKSLFFTPILKTSEIMLPVLTDWFNDLKSSVVEEDTNATD
jgi:membrane protein required for colicin V production